MGRFCIPVHSCVDYLPPCLESQLLGALFSVVCQSLGHKLICPAYFHTKVAAPLKQVGLFSPIRDSILCNRFHNFLIDPNHISNWLLLWHPQLNPQHIQVYSGWF